MAKKCSKCGALNASSMEVCGSCKAPLGATEMETTRSANPVRKKLSGLLLRIENNLREDARKPVGRLFRSGKRTFSIGFKTENEEVTLIVPPDQIAVLTDDSQSIHNLDFEGPEKDVLGMLEAGGNISILPDSIRVKIGGRELPPGISTVMADPLYEGIMREGAVARLRVLLRQ